jgi:HD superfamily phosphohydrolase YqeK
LCEKWHIITDYPQDSFFDLIHADTGAETARREYRMPEAVCRCIARHTVGAEDMTLEEQIIYWPTCARRRAPMTGRRRCARWRGATCTPP